MRLIDADALKEVIFSKTNGMEDLWDTAGVLNAINNAPTVKGYKNVIVGGMNNPYNAGYMEGIRQAYKELERPQGEWKYICSYANTHLLRYECSKCGRTVDVYKRQELLVKYPFCHCGADMRKGGTE